MGSVMGGKEDGSELCGGEDALAIILAGSWLVSTQRGE